MRSLMYLVSLLLLLPVLQSQEYSSNGNYMMPDGQIKKKADQARNYCQTQYGSELASIHSPEQQTEAYNLCMSVFPSLSADGCIIGLNDISNERGGDRSGWTYFDGTPYDYQNWHTFQPDQGGGNEEDCVALARIYMGKWIDLPCDNTATEDTGFICNTPANEPTQAPTSSTLNPSKMPANPTNNPSAAPTRFPTKIPTHYPTNNPTSFPTQTPFTPTHDPTNDPTVFPTYNPTVFPSETPITSHTVAPTHNPTNNPTSFPTQTQTPTHDLTNDPIVFPTDNPTVFPSETPTNDPTNHPTSSPLLSTDTNQDGVIQSQTKKKMNIIFAVVCSVIGCLSCVICGYLVRKAIKYYNKQREVKVVAKVVSLEPMNIYNGPGRGSDVGIGEKYNDEGMDDANHNDDGFIEAIKQTAGYDEDCDDDIIDAVNETAKGMCVDDMVVLDEEGNEMNDQEIQTVIPKIVYNMNAQNDEIVCGDDETATGR